MTDQPIEVTVLNKRVTLCLTGRSIYTVGQGQNKQIVGLQSLSSAA